MKETINDFQTFRQEISKLFTYFLQEKINLIKPTIVRNDGDSDVIKPHL